MQHAVASGEHLARPSGDRVVLLIHSPRERFVVPVRDDTASALDDWHLQSTDPDRGMRPHAWISTAGDCARWMHGLLVAATRSALSTQIVGKLSKAGRIAAKYAAAAQA
jgi:hypothetical protein